MAIECYYDKCKYHCEYGNTGEALDGPFCDREECILPRDHFVRGWKDGEPILVKDPEGSVYASSFNFDKEE